jgi:uncharacterized membrane protein
MKDYIVVFMFKGLWFHERTRVYGVNDRSQAIQIVKDHYGSGNIKIISARMIKEC